MEESGPAAGGPGLTPLRLAEIRSALRDLRDDAGLPRIPRDTADLDARRAFDRWSALGRAMPADARRLAREVAEVALTGGVLQPHGGAPDGPAHRSGPAAGPPATPPGGAPVPQPSVPRPDGVLRAAVTRVRRLMTGPGTPLPTPVSAGRALPVSLLRNHRFALHRDWARMLTGTSFDVHLAFHDMWQGRPRAAGPDVPVADRFEAVSRAHGRPPVRVGTGPDALLSVAATVRSAGHGAEALVLASGGPLYDGSAHTLVNVRGTVWLVDPAAGSAVDPASSSVPVGAWVAAVGTDADGAALPFDVAPPGPPPVLGTARGPLGASRDGVPLRVSTGPRAVPGYLPAARVASSPLDPSSAAWRRQRERAAPAEAGADVVQPWVDADGWPAVRGTRATFDVRRFEVEPGRWVRELTLAIRFTGTPRAVEAASALARETAEEISARNYLFPDGDQLHVSVELADHRITPHTVAVVDDSYVHGTNHSHSSRWNLVQIRDNLAAGLRSTAMHEMAHRLGTVDRYTRDASDAAVASVRDLTGIMGALENRSRLLGNTDIERIDLASRHAVVHSLRLPTADADTAAAGPGRGAAPTGVPEIVVQPAPDAGFRPSTVPSGQMLAAIDRTLAGRGLAAPRSAVLAAYARWNERTSGLSYTTDRLAAHTVDLIERSGEARTLPAAPPAAAAADPFALLSPQTEARPGAGITALLGGPPVTRQAPAGLDALLLGRPAPGADGPSPAAGLDALLLGDPSSRAGADDAAPEQPRTDRRPSGGEWTGSAADAVEFRRLWRGDPAPVGSPAGDPVGQAFGAHPADVGAGRDAMVRVIRAVADAGPGADALLQGMPEPVPAGTRSRRGDWVGPVRRTWLLVNDAGSVRLVDLAAGTNVEATPGGIERLGRLRAVAAHPDGSPLDLPPVDTGRPRLDVTDEPGARFALRSDAHRLLAPGLDGHLALHDMWWGRPRPADPDLPAGEHSAAVERTYGHPPTEVGTGQAALDRAVETVRRAGDGADALLLVRAPGDTAETPVSVVRADGQTLVVLPDGPRAAWAGEATVPDGAVVRAVGVGADGGRLPFPAPERPAPAPVPGPAAPPPPAEPAPAPRRGPDPLRLAWDGQLRPGRLDTGPTWYPGTLPRATPLTDPLRPGPAWERALAAPGRTALPETPRAAEVDGAIGAVGGDLLFEVRRFEAEPGRRVTHVTLPIVFDGPPEARRQARALAEAAVARVNGTYAFSDGDQFHLAVDPDPRPGPRYRIRVTDEELGDGFDGVSDHRHWRVDRILDELATSGADVALHELLHLVGLKDRYGGDATLALVGGVVDTDGVMGVLETRRDVLTQADLDEIETTVRQVVVDEQRLPGAPAGIDAAARATITPGADQREAIDTELASRRLTASDEDVRSVYTQWRRTTTPLAVDVVEAARAVVALGVARGAFRGVADAVAGPAADRSGSIGPSYPQGDRPGDTAGPGGSGTRSPAVPSLVVLDPGTVGSAATRSSAPRTVDDLAWTYSGSDPTHAAELHEVWHGQSPAPRAEPSGPVGTRRMLEQTFGTPMTPIGTGPAALGSVIDTVRAAGAGADAVVWGSFERDPAVPPTGEGRLRLAGPTYWNLLNDGGTVQLVELRTADVVPATADHLSHLGRVEAVGTGADGVALVFPREDRPFVPQVPFSDDPTAVFGLHEPTWQQLRGSGLDGHLAVHDLWWGRPRATPDAVATPEPAATPDPVDTSDPAGSEGNRGNAREEIERTFGFPPVDIGAGPDAWARFADALHTGGHGGSGLVRIEHPGDGRVETLSVIQVEGDVLVLTPSDGGVRLAEHVVVPEDARLTAVGVTGAGDRVQTLPVGEPAPSVPGAPAPEAPPAPPADARPAALPGGAGPLHRVGPRWHGGREPAADSERLYRRDAVWDAQRAAAPVTLVRPDAVTVLPPDEQSPGISRFADLAPVEVRRYEVFPGHFVRELTAAVRLVGDPAAVAEATALAVEQLELLNHRYRLPGGDQLHLSLDLSPTRPEHQVVVVEDVPWVPGQSATSHQGRWQLDQIRSLKARGSAVAAHELSHVFGLPDRYGPYGNAAAVGGTTAYDALMGPDGVLVYTEADLARLDALFGGSQLPSRPLPSVAAPTARDRLVPGHHQWAAIQDALVRLGLPPVRDDLPAPVAPDGPTASGAAAANARDRAAYDGNEAYRAALLDAYDAWRRRTSPLPFDVDTLARATVSLAEMRNLVRDLLPFTADRTDRFALHRGAWEELADTGLDGHLALHDLWRGRPREVVAEPAADAVERTFGAPPAEIGTGVAAWVQVHNGLFHGGDGSSALVRMHDPATGRTETVSMIHSRGAVVVLTPSDGGVVAAVRREPGAGVVVSAVGTDRDGNPLRLHGPAPDDTLAARSGPAHGSWVSEAVPSWDVDGDVPAPEPGRPPADTTNRPRTESRP